MDFRQFAMPALYFHAEILNPNIQWVKNKESQDSVFFFLREFDVCVRSW